MRSTLLLACAQLAVGLAPVLAGGFATWQWWSSIQALQGLASDALLGIVGRPLVAELPLGPLILLVPAALYAVGVGRMTTGRRSAIVMMLAVAAVQGMLVAARGMLTAAEMLFAWPSPPPGLDPAWPVAATPAWPVPRSGLVSLAYVAAPLLTCAADGWIMWRLAVAWRVPMVLLGDAANPPAPLAIVRIRRQATRWAIGTGAAFSLVGLHVTVLLFSPGAGLAATDSALTMFLGGPYAPWAPLFRDVAHLAPLAYLVPAVLYIVCGAFLRRGLPWAMWTCFGLAAVQCALSFVGSCCLLVYVFQLGRLLARDDEQGPLAMLLMLLVLLAMTARSALRAVRGGYGAVDGSGHAFEPIVAQPSHGG